MAVKKVVKAVAKKVVKKKVATKVIKDVAEVIDDVVSPVDTVALQLASVVGNYILKIEVENYLKGTKYDKDLLYYHLDRIEGARVSKQELLAIAVSLFR